MKKKQKVKILRIVSLLVAFISTVVFPPWAMFWAWIVPVNDTVQEEVNKALRHGFDGIVVYVDEGGKTPQFYAAGCKNRQHQIPADPHSLFKIASISKLYVAVAIAKLVKDEKLSLERSLSDYFPHLVERIEYSDRITLKMLVQHTSGIPNYTETPKFWEDPPVTNEATLELALDLPARFEPGEDYEYSNTNYLLLSMLIDKAVGYNHQEYIKEAILIPNGLTNTFGSIHEIDMENLMSGYYVGIEEDIKSADYGSMVATAEDVGKFLRALNDGSLFEDGEQEIYSSIYVYDHTGLIPGYQSIAKYHKDIDTVVIQFINTTDFSNYQHWGLSEIVYNRVVKILRKDH